MGVYPYTYSPTYLAFDQNELFSNKLQPLSIHLNRNESAWFEEASQSYRKKFPKASS